MIVLLFPIIYGLYKSNNFASFSSLTIFVVLIIVYTFLVKRNLQTHFFKMLIFILLINKLILKDYLSFYALRLLYALVYEIL